MRPDGSDLPHGLTGGGGVAKALPDESVAKQSVQLDVQTEMCLLGAGQTWGNVNATLRDTGYPVLPYLPYVKSSFRYSYRRQSSSHWRRWIPSRGRRLMAVP
jgi:hypothetical protein